MPVVLMTAPVVTGGASLGSVAPWITGADLAADPRAAGVTLPAGVTWDDIAQAATDWLYKRSGRKYTTQRDVLRPVPEVSCGCASWRRWDMSPVGLWIDSCLCAPLEVRLPGPVQTIHSVTVDGAVVPSSDYHVYDLRTLVALNGRTWRCCQSLSLPITAVGTMAVDVTYGDIPPAGGILAARELALELGKAYAGQACRLPARTRSVARQGVSFDVTNTAYMSDGQTGIATVDLWVLSENPHKLRRSASVASPDTIHHATT